MPPLSKQYGNAGRIARWIFENIEDPLDYWEYGSVTGARSDIRLGMGDTVVTLENKWWGVYSSFARGLSCDSLLATWNLKHLWAPVWLREKFSASWATKVFHDSLKDRESFCWDQIEASKSLRAAMPHKVY